MGAYHAHLSAVRARRLNPIRYWKKTIKIEAAIRETRLRLRREKLKIVPSRWISSSGLLMMDLDIYANSGGKAAFDTAYLENMVKGRDALHATIRKQMSVTLLIGLFLFGSYLGIGFDFSIAGFSIKNTKGAAEALLIISSAISLYTLILQSNSKILDAAIKVGISKLYPIELQSLYRIRYFPHEEFGTYYPVSLPFISPSPLTSKLKIYTPRLFLSVLASAFLIFFGCSVLVWIDVWQAAKLGIWSKVTISYVAVLGLYSFSYIIVTQFPLRYRDFTINDELELRRQVAPETVHKRSNEVHRTLNKEQRRLRWLVQRSIFKRLHAEEAFP